ncbi:hypothetical protein GYH30_020454 [Glycine max]|nr:hypothetical protein GYH30_020454 [Glycine max]
MVQSCWSRRTRELIKLPRYPCKHYVGSSNGILIAEIEPLHMYYPCNPTHGEVLRLLFWDPKVPIKLAVLSSPPEDHNCTVMILTGISDPAFALCKVKETCWVTKWRWSKDCVTVEPQNQRAMQDCTLTEQLGKQQVMQFTNAIGFKGKFYVLSVKGSLAVIEEVDSVPKVTNLSDTRIVFLLFHQNHFREYLLESDGEVLLVFLIPRKSSMHIVDNVEVYQLNTGRLSWVN